jgi:hypothetical protein
MTGIRLLTAVERFTSTVLANTPTSASFPRMHCSAAHAARFFTPTSKPAVPNVALYSSLLGTSPNVAESRQPAPGVTVLPHSKWQLMGQLDLPAHHDEVYGYTNKEFDLAAELADVRETSLEGWSARTTKLERSHLRYWRAFCKERGLRVWRDDHDANCGRNKHGYQREVDVLCAFLLYVVRHIKPKSKRPEALPSSSMNVVRGVRRAQAKRVPPIEMVPVKAAKPVLKAITKRYMRKHGYKTLLPRRREPWRKPHLKKMFKLRTQHGVKLGTHTVSGSLFWICIFAMLETLAQSGMRCSEALVASLSAWHPAEHLTRANLVWCIGGVLFTTPSRAQLEGLTEDDYALLIPPPSKTDEFGVIWGDKPMYLPIRFKADYCAALRLREIELAFPLDSDETRAQTPLFCTDSFEPITHDTAHKILAAIKELVLTDEWDKSLFTFHSFRVTLASQMGEMDCSDSEIQSMCRWQTKQSLRIYKRMQPAAAIQLLDKAAKANLKSYTAANIPTISSYDYVMGIHAYNARRGA